MGEPDPVAALRNIIARAFAISGGYLELNGLTSQSSGLDLYNDLGLDQMPMKIVVDRLFAELQVRGKLDDFARAAFTHLCGSGDLRAWVRDQHADWLPDISEADFEAARPGYESDRQVRRVGVISVALQSVSATALSLDAGQRALAIRVVDELDALSGYKRVHDLLHDLQFRIVGELFRIADPPFPEDQRAASVSILADEMETARSEIDQLTGEYDALRAADCMPIVDAIVRVRTLLVGPDRLDPITLTEAQMTIRAMLRQQMPRFDGQMVEASRAIPFEPFAAMLRQLIPAGADVTVAGSTAERLTSAADAIGWLDRRLETRRLVHKLWQQIDVILMAIEEVLSGSGRGMELAVHWKNLRALFAQMAQTSNDLQETDLLDSARPIDTAAADRFSIVDIALRQDFATFTRRSRLRFRIADTALLKDCQELSKLRAPIETFVR